MQSLKLQFKNWQGGQALLIVVLIMVIALTVGLSVASRSITNLRTATDEANSQKAFSAAEAGIERALKLGDGFSNQSLGNGSTIQNVSVDAIDGSKILLNGGNLIFKDDGVDLFLIAHNSDGSLNYSSGWQNLPGNRSLTIYWGPESDTCSTNEDNIAALEIITLSGSSSSPVSTREAIDPCSSRRANNNFSDYDKVPPGGQGPPYTLAGTNFSKTFAYKKTIDISNLSRGLLVRVIPLYADTVVGARGCDHNVADSACQSFPEQGKIIESVGVSNEATRKVVYYQGFPKLPSEFFQYVLFSH